MLTKATQTEHRCLAKFRDLNILFAWNQAWSHLRTWRFVRSVQDTACLTFHGILPTADRLVRFSINVSPASFCGEPETFVHLFTSCPFASEVFQWFTIQLHQHHPTAALTSGQILFGFESASGVPIVFTALLGILRHHVWLARNKHRFEQVPPDAPATLKNAKSTVCGCTSVIVPTRCLTAIGWSMGSLVASLNRTGSGSPGTSSRSSLGFLCFFPVVTFPMKVWGSPLVVVLPVLDWDFVLFCHCNFVFNF